MDKNYIAIAAYSGDHWDSVFCSAGGVSISNIYPKCTFKSQVAHSFDESATQHNFFPPFLFSPHHLLHPSTSRHRLTASFR
ncbi:uncharacterized protein LACBIDRAFT_317730 [Laccaria bicolor S238N-H82]|uniref:Predicted protein n=1 Tax=Laccaria bicolor (strain S238N-H82 / ATCC MYA-4686) TaxID=486041 RepID=B0E293_LACBS|nr:uncharacterized protein LACBIDRAFT_317730 [Laccaria bicolor S238N-H82]EDQ99037.1 predicted protein [Laccaria bicolor S238N-H82]|eukprot:XP_001890312.1 predicted protein [Laccaria bicolor S238N-H82]